MKLSIKISAFALLLSAASQGSTTITGTIGSAFKDAGLINNIPTGSLIMLVVDNTADGFLANGAQGGITSGSTVGLAGKTLTVAQAGITVGSLFGGDTVFATSTSGGSGSIAGFAGFDPAAAVGKSFSLVWFTQTQAALTTSIANAAFGMIRLSDWTLPADAEGKSYSLSSTDVGGLGSFFSSSVSTTATQLGAVGFFSGSGIAADVNSTAARGASFTVAGVPEPSSILLGAIGVFSLLRRRRN